MPGIAPEAALAWWADYQEGNADHPFLPTTRRRILARGKESITMEEVMRVLGVTLFRESVTARVAPGEVRFRGQNDLVRFEGVYAFEEEGDGTRIRLDADVWLRPALAWSGLVARPIVVAVLWADLAGHVREMRRDLRA